MRPLALLLALGALGGAVTARQGGDGFDHAKHAKLFPSCDGCHAGIREPARSVWPTAESCASCHDGTIQKRVDWVPRSGPRISNLRFTHAEHARESTEKFGADSTLACSECHTPDGRTRMNVQPLRAESCLTCHDIRTEHVAAPDTACATCHLTLAEAGSLPRERIAKFAEPASHKEPRFLDARGHGAQAKPPAGSAAGVAPSCATCHARDFCTQCHVNAPEVAVIQALAPDSRSLAISAELKPPANHDDSRFQSRHGRIARRNPASCATCHTRESCLACHRAQLSVAGALAVAGPGRGAGARIVRKLPATHGKDFADRHGPLASSAASTCSACHARTECLDCHRPAAGNTGSYHPAGFLVRHPAAAYARQSDCSECHNQAQFCTTCHQQTGLTANSPLQGGFHETRPGFVAGHGQAARQSLESCVTCHSERDCLVCHSAQGGRRFDPHGPGFDPERLKRRNPQVCAACHGQNIPGN